jgi:formamidopyrimidine-DNA glycosylase
MPELPEVKNISDILRNILIGNYFHGILINEKSRYAKENKEIKGEKYLEKEITKNNDILYPSYGKFTDIYIKGKKIFFVIKLKNGEFIILFSFLSLHGTWRINEDIPYLKITLLCSSRKNKLLYEKNLYFNDKSNFGTLEILKTDLEYEYILKDTGPDYLSGKINGEIFLEKLKEKKFKKKEIGVFLLEQQHFSGVGAYINSECLYKSKISPFRLIEELSDIEIYLLYDNIMEVMNESYKLGGHSFVDYVDPYGNNGSYKTEIHEHNIDSFGNKITKEKMKNNRNVFYVKNLQL